VSNFKTVPLRILLLSSIFIQSISIPARASIETNLCRDTDTTFVFFNGVQTTKTQAKFYNQVFSNIHGNQSSQGDSIKYETLYNYSNGFEDFVETFEQRLKEQEGLLQGRYELFFEALQGGGPWWSKIIEAYQPASEVIKSFIDFYRAGVFNYLTTFLANPPTTENYIEHRSRIDNWILEGKKLLFVAHSQGNLFANAAYNYALTKTTSGSVKVVHIAPASPTLNGEHTLADLDLVINALRAAGSVPSITDNIPPYLSRPAGIDNQTDILGHGLLSIYINQKLAISTRVKNQIDSALAALIAPPASATSGFFTATLTWNGTGDVDLHAFEPSGSHVFYRSLAGTSGYLDVDNTSANGPEHYYASCDASKLQPGTYQIAVANFSKADGRVATVQVASWSEGVLGTKSVTMGPATKDVPTYPMFNVVVSKDDRTGKYSVSLAQ